MGRECGVVRSWNCIPKTRVLGTAGTCGSGCLKARPDGRVRPASWLWDASSNLPTLCLLCCCGTDTLVTSPALKVCWLDGGLGAAGEGPAAKGRGTHNRWMNLCGQTPHPCITAEMCLKQGMALVTKFQGFRSLLTAAGFN